MRQEVRITQKFETPEGETVEEELTKDFSAMLSRGRLLSCARSELYGRPEVAKVLSLDIKEEAEIYGNT
jgi:hypothetical protein